MAGRGRFFICARARPGGGGTLAAPLFCAPQCKPSVGPQLTSTRDHAADRLQSFSCICMFNWEGVNEGQRTWHTPSGVSMARARTVQLHAMPWPLALTCSASVLGSLTCTTSVVEFGVPSNELLGGVVNMRRGVVKLARSGRPRLRLWLPGSWVLDKPP